MEIQSYYLTRLKEDLSLKQRKNPLYSLRAYATHLGVHPATLSQILNGNRPLPLKNSSQVVSKLNLGPIERTLFMESLLKSKISIDNIKVDDPTERFMLDESYHKVIAQWEHYAVLELFKIDDFECTVDEIAQRLDLTQTRAEVVINNLITCGLLKHNTEGALVKTYSDIRTTEDISSQALKESHLETLTMAIDKLDEIEVELRDFSSATLALDLNKLPEAKHIIREFRGKMIALLKDGKSTEVYQLAIQLYPLTKTRNKKN